VLDKLAERYQFELSEVRYFMSTLSHLLLRGQKIRPVTKHLVELLLDDRPLTPACTVDFGVDSADHYYALRNMFCGEIHFEAREGDPGAIEELRKRVVELDLACGHGPRLNALVRHYAPEFAEVVHFQTSWDIIDGRTQEEMPEKR
jgi:hypothetical protein